MKHVLVTGGAGYIGSHACKALRDAGFVPVTYDNLVTGWEDAVTDLTGVRVQMTTCNAALLTLTAQTWADAATRSGWTLEQLVRPKEL